MLARCMGGARPALSRAPARLSPPIAAWGPALIRRKETACGHGKNVNVLVAGQEKAELYVYRQCSKAYLTDEGWDAYDRLMDRYSPEADRIHGECTDRLWEITEGEAMLRPSTVEAAEMSDVMVAMWEGGLVPGDDIPEDEEWNIPELEPDEEIYEEPICHFEIGERTIAEYEAEHGIPEGELEDLLNEHWECSFHCSVGVGRKSEQNTCDLTE